MGTVIVKFYEEMITPQNFTSKITFGNVTTFDQKVLPVLDVQMLRPYNESALNFTWTCENFTNQSMRL